MQALFQIGKLYIVIQLSRLQKPSSKTYKHEKRINKCTPWFIWFVHKNFKEIRFCFSIWMCWICIRFSQKHTENCPFNHSLSKNFSNFFLALRFEKFTNKTFTKLTKEKGCKNMEQKNKCQPQIRDKNQFAWKLC